MKLLVTYQKQIAMFFLLTLAIEFIIPTTAAALTSGPAQPEMKGFEPIGNSDMVDLSSGDFSYNIPLMDVGGYPVNLAYGSGAGMDDEASWVGYGWNVNVGSVNRNLRGLPDDFNGTDEVQREMSTKDHKTYGGKFSMTVDVLGIPVTKFKSNKKKRKLNLNLTVSVGVRVDNYRGIGMELGANPGVSLTNYTAGEFTQSKEDSATSSFGVGVELSLSSFGGAGINVNNRIISKKTLLDDKVGHTKSIGFGYNTRGGGASLTVDLFKDPSLKFGGKTLKKTIKAGALLNSFLDFSGDSYSPTIDMPTKSDSYNFTLHVGPELWVALPAIGVSGFYTRQRIANKNKSAPAYGFMHAEKGKDHPDAVMDFNREKDIPYNNKVKYLPIPVPTYDLYSATSQDGAGQYRVYRGSSGVFFDPKSEISSDNLSLGIEFGAGFFWDVGADLYKQDINTTTQKWIKRNQYLGKGDFQPGTITQPDYETAYFKRVGEPVPFDSEFGNKIKNTSAVAISLPARIDDVVSGAKASDQLRTKSSSSESISVLKRDKREVRNTAFSYLTAMEAYNHGLDKTIKSVDPGTLVISGCSSSGVDTINRIGSYRKPHHISEITITGDDGKRSVFGLPVYNKYQEEVTFSVTENKSLRTKGLISYSGTDNSIGNQKGKDNYFSKEKTPPYTTSHLLTAILSPDYVDKTGNGVSDDDLGTAVKFNYTKLSGDYKWRTPFADTTNIANYNEGLLSDALDDKGNYVYGEKEIWYLHSIESKTLVAHFITEDRDDALGVSDNNGVVNSSFKQKRLKEIRLYSKSDLRLHDNNPALTVPIKVVHFVHDYSICRGLPNNVNGEGKLTLKRIYFTFGTNLKGRLNPYDFSYDTTYNTYDYRQFDRWGNFKDVANNPGSLNNSEFPYTIQDEEITNASARLWQLNRIVLPSGGIINIEYESDDYAWVQDRRASEMCTINGVGAPGQSHSLVGADYIYINLPQAVNSHKEMRERYFENITNLYYKFFLDLDAKGHSEFVPGYAELDLRVLPERYDSTIAKVKLKKVQGVNPIAKDGWQFLRTSLPKYAYPGSENIEDKGSDLQKAIKALVVAYSTISEFFQGFEKRAKSKGYSNNVDLTKSWVRLCSPSWKKLGGGSRVKKIIISDDWEAMSGTDNSKTSTYTQVYDYSTKDSKGRTVSTGVASYEPMLGNDENPFRQPVRYAQKEFLGLNNYYYIEEPFGESFFPGASIVYSKVSVKTVGTGEEESNNRTGTVVSEFYTAKDYPTKVDILGLEHRKPITSKIFKLIGGISYDMVGLSQGYSVETNDMHGKPKSVQVFNKSGQKISSVEYYYKSANELAARKELKNDVKVIRPDGQVSDGIIGMDVELFSDMREQITDNLGGSVKVSGGSGAILIFPLPFWFPGFGLNYDRRNYRSASTVKIINRFAIQYKVVKMENGSSITSENMLWDSETGNVLLTKTQNEFDDPVYSFAYPAHWKYEGMGQAYKNLGSVFFGLFTNAGGEIVNTNYNAMLHPGDELIDIFSNQKYWVINSPVSSVYKKRLIDENGILLTTSIKFLKLVRSGRRNMANTAIATIVSLKNPIIGNKLDVSQLTQVLDAKATVFDEQWSMPIAVCTSCPDGYKLTLDQSQCYKDTIPQLPSQYLVCEGDQIGPYGSCGSFVYQCNDTLERTRVGAGNQFWNAFTDDDTTYCKYDATNTATQTYGLPCPLSWVNRNGFQAKPDTVNGLTLERNLSVAGRLNRTGIWNCGGAGPINTWIGFERTFNITVAKTYYLGIGCDNEFRAIVNGIKRFYSDSTSNQENFKIWHIFPLYLDTGLQTIKFEAMNSGSQASFGAELYNNTIAELDTATGYGSIDTLFSTENMVGQYFNSGDTVCAPGYTKTIINGDSVVCRKYAPLDTVIINPYYTGLLGNWRPRSSYVYQVNRENKVSDPSKAGSTDIRKSGAYSLFSPFWNYSSSTWNQSSDVKWIAANEITYINEKGADIENKDALNRYSSAIFGYLQSMPVGVASNARYREIAFDGFEDYGFALDCASADTCNNAHFNFQKKINGSSVDTTSVYSHSGKYSLKLNGNVLLEKSVFTGSPGPIFTFNSRGEYLLGSNELSKGFSPVPGKKYILSFWVKDADPRLATSGIGVTVNGTSLVNNLLKWPVVEGWKRVETQFTLPSIATNFELSLQSSGVMYIDDIRIHPADGQMKSFSYDASTQRLMAEMDENNFATFYEYDDEGVLIRVKKETERGIMTIRETRSSYRKR